MEVTMALLISFGLITQLSNADSAQVTTHCDNTGTLFLSTDAGSTFTQVAYMDSWPTAMSYTVADVTCDTVLKMNCYDYGGVGGVIITVDYNEEQYSTTNPITDGYWQLLRSSDGVTEPLVYSNKTSRPWSISTEAIADDAVWVWNENTYNTMVFQFDFADLCGTTADPTTDPTTQPSPSPTLDGCDFDLETYLDSCYCEGLQSGLNFGSAHSDYYQNNELNGNELFEIKYDELLDKYQEMSHLMMWIILALVFIICAQIFILIAYAWSNRQSDAIGYKHVELDEQQPLD